MVVAATNSGVRVSVKMTDERNVTTSTAAQDHRRFQTARTYRRRSMGASADVACGVEAGIARVRA
jgi:hypothetical protein